MKSNKVNKLEVLKFLIVCLTHADESVIDDLPHPSYVLEKFQSSMIGLDNENTERLKKYLANWYFCEDDFR